MSSLNQEIRDVNKEIVHVNSKMTNYGMEYRKDLQGIRAIAVLLVVVAHSGLGYIPGGVIGVDVFFVLSGYLITGLLLRELAQSGDISLKRFYARRMMRLFPALAVMVIITTILSALLLSRIETRNQLASTPYALTWTSNLYFAFSNFDYFNEYSDRDLFLHTWSLGVEEQFYLVWPLLFLVLYRLISIKRRNGLFDVVIFALAALSALSFLFALYLLNKMPLAAFYLMPARVWQLSIGALVFCYIHKKAKESEYTANGLSSVVNNLLLIFGIIMIIGSSIILEPKITNLGGWVIIPSLGTVLIITSGYGSSHKDSIAEKWLISNPVMIWLGDRSYSLYLWHWPVFVLGFSMGFQEQLPATAVMFTLSVVCAAVSYRYVELPFWRGRWSSFEPKYVLIFCCLFVSSAIAMHVNTMRILPQSIAIGNLSDAGATVNFNVKGSHKWRTDSPAIYRFDCDSWFSSARVEPCVFGAEGSRNTVVLLGDSIGAQWFSMIPEIFKHEWRLIVFTKSSCAMVDVEYYYPRIGKVYEVCSEWRSSAISEIRKLAPDVIIMGSAASYNFSENEWVEGTARILDRLRHASTSIYIIPGTPSLGFDGPGCLSRNLDSTHIDDQRCGASNRMSSIEPVATYLKVAASKYENVSVLDLNHLVCPGGICKAMNDNGVVVYRDSQHLTDTFVKTQTDEILVQFKKSERFIDLHTFDDSVELTNRAAAE